MSGKPDKAELEQLLSTYIDGTCSDAERQRVEQALQRDPGLRALHAQLSRTVDAIRAMPAEAAPSHVRERILEQLERRALLGVSSGPAGSLASATPQAPARRHSTAWMGLVAAAMLMAGVGATWWFRMHADRFPSHQIAMAPSQDRSALRKGVPSQEEYGQGGAFRGGPGSTLHGELPPPQNEGQGGAPDANQPVPGLDDKYPPQPTPPSATPQTPLETARPEVSTAPQVPPSPSPAVTAEPRGSLLADSQPERQALGKDASRPVADQTTDNALDMRGGGSSIPPATPQHSLVFGGKATAEPSTPQDRVFSYDTKARTQSEAAPAKSAERLALNREGELPPSAPAAPPVASLAARAAAGVPVAGFARLVPAKAKQSRTSLAFLPSADTPVTRLQVAVRDTSRQVALTGDVIRDRVRGQGGQAIRQADPSVILAAVPAGHQVSTAREIADAPGVLHVQSHILPAGDPLATEALSLAATQWLHSSCLLPGPDLLPPSPSTLRSGDVTYYFSNAWALQEYTPLVIVLQPTPVATSQPTAE